jgi:3-deoxy-D-manno-octulosonic-acid transferase
LAVKFLLKNVLGRISACCAQSERDASRFKMIGLKADKIRATGNMKFDAALAGGDFNINNRLQDKLGLKGADTLLVSGSTHRGEEEIILKAYKKIRVNFVNLKLLIAPRHPERSKEVEELVSKHNFDSAMVSALSTGSVKSDKTVFILDTIGALVGYYSIADIVFVGGSLINKGGHNILEPAGFSKPVIFGPFMSNFRDIADLFINNNAAIMLRNAADLGPVIIKLLNNPQGARELGRKGNELIALNRGATLRNVKVIKEVLSPF